MLSLMAAGAVFGLGALSRRFGTGSGFVLLSNRALQCRSSSSSCRAREHFVTLSDSLLQYLVHGCFRLLSKRCRSGSGVSQRLRIFLRLLRRCTLCVCEHLVGSSFHLSRQAGSVHQFAEMHVLTLSKRL